MKNALTKKFIIDQLAESGVDPMTATWIDTQDAVEDILMGADPNKELSDGDYQRITERAEVWVHKICN